MAEADVTERCSLGASLAARLEHVARILGTGFLFAVFGIGALLLAAIVIPWVARRRHTAEARELLAQRMIQRAFALFVWLGTGLGVLGLRESGTERLRAGKMLVVANHPTLLDVVFLISRMPQADCIVKREAWRNPFLRGIVRTAGYIPNDAGDALVDACVERLRAGRSVLLFPEGSRSPEGGLGRFQRGAAHVALRAGASITPVLVTSEPPCLMKAQPWYEVPNSKLEFSLVVGDPLHTKELTLPDARNAIAARELTAELRAYFEERLGHGGT